MTLQRVLLVLEFMLLGFVFMTISTTYATPFFSGLVTNEPAPLHWHYVARVSTSPAIIFNVEAFGAKGDGRTDDSQAFTKAWEKACSTAGATLVLPKTKNYLLKPVTFSGPCISTTTLKIFGTIQASTNQLDYKQDTTHWLLFQNVQNLKVEGGGTINGNGNIWWKNSCKINKALPCVNAPTALTFYQCNNLVVRNIRILDAQQMHLTFQKCVNVQALNLMVTAPEASPNTDGIHVAETKNIDIINSVIGTGDDCISLVDGSQKVRAMNITCGPGHGISIGSLGADHSKEYVSDVLVDTARLTKTMNGVRIKTWQGGSGSATNIVFQNIIMNDVKNPIIIDQNYCDQAGPCKGQKSAVQISNVMYKNIRGTIDSEVGVTLDCSKSHPCQGIKMQNVNLVNQGAAEALCNNVKVANIGKISPSCP